MICSTYRFGYAISEISSIFTCSPFHHLKSRTARHSGLQLAFELVQELPIGAVGNDLLRVRFDEARFIQSQGVKADRVLGVVLAPFVVRQLTKHLKRVVVASGETAIDELSSDSRRLGDAEVRRLEYGAQRAFRRDRIPLEVVPVAREHAAIILRPWAVDRDIENHMPDTPGAQLLRFGRTTYERIDPSVSEKLHQLDGRADDPADILDGVESDISRHDRAEHVRAGP